MLKLAQNKDKQIVTDFSAIHPIGVRIACGALAYGLEGKMFSVWIQYNDKEEVTALYSSFGGASTLVASDDADFEELALFLGSGNSSLCADVKTFEHMGITPTEVKQMFQFTSLPQEFNEVSDFADERQMYSLVSKAIPGSFKDGEENYLDFLSDLTYRRNRNLARVKAINTDKVTACCITAAEDDKRALISAVACDESARGKGYGKKVVLSMVNSIVSENKTAYVIALNDSAKGFYNAIGFTPVAEIGYI